MTMQGTIYTNKWLNNITDGVAATNYTELVQGAVTPVRPDIKYSPFIVSDDGSKPGKHVLVQTQCSRTCATCQPIDDPLAFRQSCRWVNAVPEQNRTGGDYPEDLVQGIVIQLRNPYDVIRTRVNRGIKSERKTLEWTDEQVNERKNTRQALESYCKIVDSAFIPNPSDRRTLFFKSEAWKRPRKFFKRAFCEWRYRYPLPKYQMVDAFYESSKRNFHYFSNATKFSDIPCFWDWLRYIQWHNYLLEFATKFPTHVVYFEDYMTDRKHAFEDLAAFMDRKIESPLLPPLNLERAKHIMLYTPQEQSRIAELVHHFASPKVLEILQPYLNISAYNSPPMTTTS